MNYKLNICILHNIYNSQLKKGEGFVLHVPSSVAPAQLTFMSTTNRDSQSLYILSLTLEQGHCSIVVWMIGATHTHWLEH